MDKQFFLEFQQKIKQFTDHGNLEDATIQLMDFTREFSAQALRQREALSIRQDFVGIPPQGRVLGGHEAYKAVREQLVLRVFDLLRVIEADMEAPPEEEAQQQPGVRSFEEHLYRSPQAMEETPRPIVRAHHLVQRFGKFTLEGINLTCMPGEILAVIGENGSGKTTLLNMLAGEWAPSEGRVEYGFTESENWYVRKQGIGYLSQEPRTAPKKTLLEYLKFLAAIHGHPIESAQRFIYRFRLEEYKDATVEEISGGYKTRFELACVLIREPQLLVLDEPLAHLDINSQQILLKDLRDFARSQKRPISIVVSSQHVHEIESLADKILFLEQGKVVYYGPKVSINTDRTFHTFEVECGCDIVTSIQLMKVLHPGIDVTQWGTYMVIRTPVEVGFMDVLNVFYLNNISVMYFRNVSSSTRMHFYR